MIQSTTMIRAILSAYIMVSHGTRSHFCVSYPVIYQRKYLRVLKKTDCKFKENFDIYLTEKTVLSNTAEIYIREA